MIRKLIACALLAVLAASCATGPYYAEERHEGRIYVFGDPATHDKFTEIHHMPYTLTLIGEGPSGETVVIEVDKEDPGLQERLREEFMDRHGL